MLCLSQNGLASAGDAGDAERHGIGDGNQAEDGCAAAISIVNFKGLRTGRHLDVHQLWLQEKVASGKLRVEKVGGKTTWRMLSRSM